MNDWKTRGGPGTRRAARRAALRQLRRGAGRVLAALLVLSTAPGPALAANVLRRPAAEVSVAPDPAALQAGTATATAQARQAQSPLRRALESVRSWQAQQDAARAAAQGAAAASGVPDGLGAGGLQIADGADADASLWDGAARPTSAAGQNGRIAVTVRQSDPKAILTWRTFNVGAQTDLAFDQSAGGANQASWVALNRVVDPAAQPSRILGHVSAPGQVYVINRNGIIFGGTSQVSVATLIAAGLDIAGSTRQERDARFRAGLLSQDGLALGGDAAAAGGAVTVEAGAALAVKGYGQLVLAGGSVLNQGSLSAPDGQVLLAAGGDLLLMRGTGAGLRGYLAEVNRGGRVVNAGGGLISASRGDVTLKGADLEQLGLVTATTSAEAAGSIHLGTAYASNAFGGALVRAPVTVTFGPGSVTQILPDDDGKKVLGTTAFTASQVDARGERIAVLDGATVYAPSGSITLEAKLASDSQDLALPNATRVYLAGGARLDVSGLRDVEVAMAQNQIKAELRSNELRDNPVLREGSLRGATVWLDGRLGSSVADFSGYYDLVERDVRQVMTQGGAVNLSANEIITRQGSLIDLSGGSLAYQAGSIQHTMLVDPTGRLVRIENAKAGVAYSATSGDFTVRHARWGVTDTYGSGLAQARPQAEPGYQQGAAAGRLMLTTADRDGYTSGDAQTAAHLNPEATGAYRILDGSVAMSTVTGPYQRKAATGTSDPTQAWRERPAGASLELQKSGDVTIAPAVTRLAGGFGPETAFPAGDASKGRLLLPAGWFDGQGFAKVTVASGYTDDKITNDSSPATTNYAPGGHLVVGAGVTVDLGDGGRLSFSGKQVELGGVIRAPGGAVSLQALDLPLEVPSQALTDEDRPSIHLAAGAVIDVAGRWTNDALDGLSGPVRPVSGGSASLVASRLVLDAGSAIDVSGGAQRSGSGQVTGGKGGAITLDFSRATRPGPAASAGTLDLADGVLRGYALGAGGSLRLLAPGQVVIGDQLPAGSAARLIPTAFFSSGGFSSFTVQAAAGLTIASGAEGSAALEPLAQSLLLPALVTSGGRQVALADLPSGAVLSEVAARGVLPAWKRSAMSLAFRALDPTADAYGTAVADLALLQGARIALDPGAGSSVGLTATGRLAVDGEVRAPGGTITVAGVGNGGSSTNDRSSVVVGASGWLRSPGWTSASLVNGAMRQAVQAAGNVSISGASVRLDAGSIVDVTGIHGWSDLAAGASGISGASTRPVEVDGAAGAIAVTALAGRVAGTLAAAPGVASGGSVEGSTGSGGRITINGKGVLVVSQDGSAGAATQLAVSATALEDARADELSLAVNPSALGSSTIVFSGDVALASRRSLTLTAPALTVDPAAAGAAAGVTLASRYVHLLGAPDQSRSGAVVVRGSLSAETLAVKAETLDLEDALWLGCKSVGCTAQGFKSVQLQAAGDIRLVDGSVSGAARIGLFTASPLTIDAAQVYVSSRQQLDSTATATSSLERADSDPGFQLWSSDRITVTSNGRAAATPLSFGERLTLHAPVIEQDGVVRAPQGQIRLEGATSVTLGAGSLTSASLGGVTVPFGELTSQGGFLGYDQAGWAPSKSLLLQGASVNVGTGAVVDVSGGGDLMAYRFSPGNLGSTDLLKAAGTYAVVPSLGGAVAPVGGAAALRDGSLRVGDAVHLVGVPGLADGDYTLLPAVYALLSGGLLVQQQAGTFASAQAPLVRADGAVVASGYRTVAGTGIREAGYHPFVVMDATARARYGTDLVASFNDYASGLASSAGAAVRLPCDGGGVVLEATSSLSLQGTGRFQATASGARPGTLDVTAPRIAVTGPGTAAPDASYLQVDATALGAFGAGSLLLGGRRSLDASGTKLAVKATDLVIDTGAAASLSAAELLLAAQGTIAIKDGSVLAATGAPVDEEGPLLVSGDGALVRLSTAGRVAVSRSGGTGAAGDLAVGAARLSADGSLSLDGSRSISLSPQATFASARFDLGSATLSLGDVPAGVNGTVLSTAALRQLAGSADLLLRGRDRVDVYGDVSLGSRGGSTPTGAIALDTPLLAAQAGGTLALAAGTVTLRNGGASSPVAATPGAASATIDATTLVLGPGAVALSGFSRLAGQAGVVEARGTGTLAVAGEVSIQTAQLKAASGADLGLTATGRLALSAPAGGTAPAASTVLGGRLTLQGGVLRLDTAVSLPAGRLQATAASGALQLGPGARLDVGGRSVALLDQLQLVGGGSILLSAASDLSVDTGAVLDASGAAAGGAAGAIALAAGGAVSLAGELRGGAASGSRGGAFTLDAGTLGGNGLGTLITALGAGGFDSAVSIRQRRGDLDLGGTLRAHRVSLQADDGLVRVAGTVDASGSAAEPEGGRISLIGGRGVAVSGTVNAAAGAAAGGGLTPASGLVELASDGGRVSLAAGATVDLSGGRRDGGRLVLRAARQGQDLAVDPILGTVRGAREVDAQGLASYQATAADAGGGLALDTALRDRLLSEASGWLAGRDAVAARLAGGNGALAGLLRVAPAMRVTSAAELAVRADVDLHGLAAAGGLELVAGGTLTVAAAVSDGFSGAARTAALGTGPSFDLLLRAGADVVLAPGALVRTGSGDLALRAGRDLVLADATSVLYTAGQRTVAAGAGLGELPSGGGDVVVEAGRDIMAPIAGQTTSAWLFRSGSTSWAADFTQSAVKQPASWSVVFANFDQGVAALGGGDVRVEAGRDVSQLQVAIPTTGLLTTAVGQVAQASDLVVRGGGDLSVEAGRDLLGGLYVLGRGRAELRAAGGVEAGPTLASLRTSASGGPATTRRAVGLLFGLMDATASVTAGNGLLVEGVFDPMRQGQAAANLSGGLGSAFWGYSEAASLQATALAGDLRYANDPWAAVDLSRAGALAGTFAVTMQGSSASGLNQTYGQAPPSLRLSALAGSVALLDPFGGTSSLTLAPSATGDLALLAQREVRLAANVTMGDVAAAYRPTALRPLVTSGDTTDLPASWNDAGTNYGRGLTLLHAADPAPARIYAVAGSVCADRTGACTPGRTLGDGEAAIVTLPKPLVLRAGLDALGGEYRLQHDDATALSSLRAGRDLFDVAVEVAGPGTLYLEAGRDLVQQALVAEGDPDAAHSAWGGLVLARGNRGNDGKPNLALPADRAASIVMLAGAAGRSDYDGFAAIYLDPANVHGVPHTYLAELRAWMKSLQASAGGLGDQALVAAFAALPEVRRRVFLDQVYLAELQATGVEFNDKESPRFHTYDRGSGDGGAVRTLFPADPGGARGDVRLGGKAVETWAEGSIAILAPRGAVEIGTGLVPDGFNPAGGGVVTRRGGGVGIMADRDIALDTSRVFTLQGGDVTMWTSNGSITAGSGAKTSVYAVPLAYTMSNDAVVAVDVFGLATGAGIGVLDALQGSGTRARSKLVLVAPQGEVDAGDAGIRVVGDLVIAALTVKGVDNIQTSGSAAGVPTVEAPNVGALTSASQAAEAAGKEAAGPQGTAAAKNPLTDLPSIVTVEVVGYETPKDGTADPEGGKGKGKKKKKP